MSSPSVFAVDDNAVQVVDGHRIFDIARDDPRAANARAVPRPGGAELSRIATISDLHIGEDGFGMLPKVRERSGSRDEHFTIRAARAAIAEAVAWGAELMVVKGDITWSARPGQWARAAELFAAAPVPIAAIVGNHDSVPRGQDGRIWLIDAGVKALADRQDHVAAVDVAGLRVVLLHTDSHGHGPARVAATTRQELLAAIDDAPTSARGTIVMAHHYPDRFSFASRYPRGIVVDDANELFADLSRLSRPPVLYTSGHTHRHRHYRRSTIDVAEVGATKDYPGVWAGYVVYEGGIRQVVRRIADP